MCRTGSRTNCATRRPLSTHPTTKPSPPPSSSSHSADASEFHLGSTSRASQSAKSRSRPPSASPPSYKQSYAASPYDLGRKQRRVLVSGRGRPVMKPQDATLCNRMRPSGRDSGSDALLLGFLQDDGHLAVFDDL